VTEPLLRMDRVTIRYGSYTALAAVSLELAPGELLAVVGPNGGGKTTLVRAVAGLVPVTEGTLQVLGTAPGKLPPGTIGYLPQMDQTIGRFPVRAADVVRMGRRALRPFPRTTPDDEAIIQRCLDEVGMARHADVPLAALSGGQRQRVLIARALAMEPRLLILDEPSTGLDAVGQEDFYATLTRLKAERNMGILIVSHDVGVVSATVDRIACLNRELHYHGPGAEVPPSMMKDLFGRDVQVLVHTRDCRTCQEHRHD